jgi:hypothetical protein
MYTPSTYLKVMYFPTYLSPYETYCLHNCLPKVKPNINSVEVHAQPSNNECQNSKNVWDTLTPYLKLPGSTAKFD